MPGGKAADDRGHLCKALRGRLCGSACIRQRHSGAGSVPQAVPVRLADRAECCGKALSPFAVKGRNACGMPLCKAAGGQAAAGSGSRPHGQGGARTLICGAKGITIFIIAYAEGECKTVKRQNDGGLRQSAHSAGKNIRVGTEREGLRAAVGSGRQKSCPKPCALGSSSKIPIGISPF